MRECEQLKRALGVPLKYKKAKSDDNDDQNGNCHYDNRNHRPDRRDYRDHQPYRHNDDRDQRYFAATTGGMIVVTTSMTTGVMIVITRMTTVATTTTARSILPPHRQKEAIPMVRSKPLMEKSTSLSVVAKQPKAIGSSDQTQGRSGTSTLKIHNLCDFRSS
jgi:hypothetical protein